MINSVIFFIAALMIQMLMYLFWILLLYNPRWINFWLRLALFWNTGVPFIFCSFEVSLVIFTNALKEGSLLSIVVFLLDLSLFLSHRNFTSLSSLFCHNMRSFTKISLQWPILTWHFSLFLIKHMCLYRTENMNYKFETYEIGTNYWEPPIPKN